MRTAKENKINLKSDLYQKIRIIDVLVLGPAMVYSGIACKNLKNIVRLFLIGSGVATIIFNGSNFLTIQKNKDVK